MTRPIEMKFVRVGDVILTCQLDRSDCNHLELYRIDLEEIRQETEKVLKGMYPDAQIIVRN